MKKLLSLLLVLLLVAGVFPINAIAETNEDEGFEITVEKIEKENPYFLKIKVSSQNEFTDVYYAVVKQAFYDEISKDNKIKTYLIDVASYLKGEIEEDEFREKYNSEGQISTGGRSTNSTNEILISLKKPMLNLDLGNDSFLYFLCLAENENNGSRSVNYGEIKINKSEINIERDISENIERALAYLSLRISGKENETLELMDIIEDIDYENVIIGPLFDKLNEDKDLHERLKNLNVDKDKASRAHAIFRDEMEGYIELEKILESGNNLSEDENFMLWASVTFDEIFKKDDAPLNGFYNKVTEKFGGFSDFLIFIKNDCEDLVKDNLSKGNLKIEYKDDGKLQIEAVKIEYFVDDIKSAFNDLEKNKGIKITPLKEGEINSLIEAANAVLENFTGDDAKTIAEYLAAQGYKVEGLLSVTPPGDGEDDEEEPGTPGGGTGGGAGGGEEVAPGKPELEIPKDETKPVEVKVPADAVKVKVVNGKATVTFDEETIEELLGLLDEAEEKAKGRKVVLVIDLAENNDIDDSAVVELPAAVIKKAYEKGAVVTANFKKFALDLPAGAFDVKDTNAVKLTFEFKNVNEAIRNINTANIANMKPVGSALDIELIVGENPVSLKNKVTLRFSVKGLTTNIDKLGVYYIDEKAGKVEFVGGKVDRAKGEIKANLQHLSTYALFEYNITFDDMAAHWAKAYIESMAAKHVVHGRTEQKFVPNDGITRAEFAKLMVTALELDLVPYKGSFEDVKSGAWYADYIQTAYENGIITGRVEGKVFDPDARITRQEIMAMVGRALAKKPVRPVDALLASFKDAAKVAEYAKEHAALLVELGIVSGYPDGTLKPEANTTRAEAVKLIYGLYNNY